MSADNLANAKRALAVGVQAPRDLLQALADELELRRRTVTTGGPGPSIDPNWAPGTPGSPESANDPTAPPISSDRGSDRKRHL